MCGCMFVGFVNRVDDERDILDVGLTVGVHGLPVGILIELVDSLDWLEDNLEQMDSLEQVEDSLVQALDNFEHYLDSLGYWGSQDFAVGKADCSVDSQQTQQDIRVAAPDSPQSGNPASAWDSQMTAGPCCKILYYVDMAVANIPIGP